MLLSSLFSEEEEEKKTKELRQELNTNSCNKCYFVFSLSATAFRLPAFSPGLI